MIWSAASPSPRASSTPSSWSASARPARVDGSDGKPDDRSGATTSGPEPTRIAVPARSAIRCAKAWSDSDRSGSTTAADDLRHRVGGDHVDPFEGGDDGALRARRATATTVASRT